MKPSLRRKLRLTLGGLRRFNRVLKGEDAGSASRHLRSSLLPPTTRHLTGLDRFLIFMSSSPVPVVLLFVVAFAVSEVFDRFKDVLPSHVEFAAAVICASVVLFHRNVRSLAHPNGVKILLLRRFHTERVPAYPLSRVMHRLVERGYQVVTLRDSIVDADRETLGGISELLGGLLAMPIPVGFLALVGGLLYLYLEIDTSAAFAVVTSGAIRWTIYATQAATVVLCLASFMRKGGHISRLMNRSGSWVLAKAAELFTRRARTLGANLGAFRHRGQLAMTIIQANDGTWLRDVQALIEASDLVIVDLSNPSENIRLEVLELGRRLGRRIPIWLRAGSQSSIVRRDPTGYEVLGVRFQGTAIEATYPSRRATNHDYRGGSNAGLNPWEYLAAATLASTIESVITLASGV